MKTVDFNFLKEEVYRTACEHGWHDEDWSDAHLLMLVITELGEAVNADRNNNYADRKAMEVWYKLDSGKRIDFCTAFEENIKDSVEDEMADAFIRMLDFCAVKKQCVLVNPSILLREDIDVHPTLASFAYHLCGRVTGFSGYRERLIGASLFLSHLYAYCESRGIDLVWHILEKMKYNALRPYKHGGKKY